MYYLYFLIVFGDIGDIVGPAMSRRSARIRFRSETQQQEIAQQHDPHDAMMNVQVDECDSEDRGSTSTRRSERLRTRNPTQQRRRSLVEEDEHHNTRTGMNVQVDACDSESLTPGDANTQLSGSSQAQTPAEIEVPDITAIDAVNDVDVTSIDDILQGESASSPLYLPSSP